jgi:hypothetical protein
MAKISWNEVVIHEFKAMLGIVAYLIFVFSALIAYRTLVLGSVTNSAFDLPLIIIKSAVIAKVILIGRLIPIIRLFDSKPLIIPTLYKTIFFVAFTFAFEMLEHSITGLIHGIGAIEGMAEFFDATQAEVISRFVLVTLAYLPMFVVGEIDRVVGGGKLFKLFFRSRSGLVG